MAAITTETKVQNYTADHNYIERPRYFCSFGGALSTLEALPETIPVLHAAGGCAGSIAWGQNGGSGLQVGGYCGGLAVPSSNIGEKEVIFGGSNRLTQEIRNTLEVMDGRLFVVITSCVTEMIGDDVQAVVSEINSEIEEKEIDAGLVFARTGGFKGNSYYGYDIVLSAIANQYVQKPIKKAKGLVNIFGIVPYMDSFWRGNLEGVRKTLELLGLKVNTFFTDEDSLDGLKKSGEAELNIVVSDLYGIEAAQAYKDRFGVPYIVSSLPVGPTASANLLRQTASALQLDIDVERIIENENRKFYRYLEPLTDLYFDADLQRYAVIVADVNYAVAVTRFLFDDLGWIPVLTQFTEILNEDQQKNLAAKLSGPGGINPLAVFDTNASETGRYLLDIYPRRETDLYVDSLTPAFVIGSSLERDLALKLGAPHLSVSFPVANRAVLNRGYTGFSGGLTLAEDLLSAAVAAR
ncbi:nitrogenase component 1 [Leadbettera azotonutricia]|uniref:NifK1 n=1 Tax=Leadbettera azotonutricia (strain ATCC BAA-888 / DSM 13862 / ZAS-9) TaxID=545695 RepID=F5YEN1_LEAAZ|nr:nitrogenase component 1 [Leadbettera azotonutricia]AEF80216.1 NifK1 [Leadbettera azotonutricia ZAS-9]